MENKDLLTQAKRMILNLSNEIEKISIENQMMKDKLLTVAKITDTQDWYQFGAVAKMLNYRGYGRNNLLAFAVSHNILRHNHEPYQTEVNAGRFKHIIKDNQYNSMVHIVPLASMKGIEHLRKLLDEEIANG